MHAIKNIKYIIEDELNGYNPGAIPAFTDLEPVPVSPFEFYAPRYLRFCLQLLNKYIAP